MVYREQCTENSVQRTCAETALSNDVTALVELKKKKKKKKKRLCKVQSLSESRIPLEGRSRKNNSSVAAIVEHLGLISR